MRATPWYKQKKFWTLVAFAAIIGTLMIVSTKYEIDWVKVIQQFIDSIL
jgi:hypothetical protein